MSKKKKFVLFVIFTTILLLLFVLLLEKFIDPDSRLIVKIAAFGIAIIAMIVGYIRAYKKYVK